MKLFVISQSENRGYDHYDSAVVAAPDEETARYMSPFNGSKIMEWNQWCNNWCYSPDEVKVTYIGEAAEGIRQGVVCASFNAR